MKLMNPVFYEKNKDGEVFYDIYSRLIKDRVIFISEDITSELSGCVTSLLFMLNNEDSDKKISLWLNTIGGDVDAFFAIYDMIQMIQAPVETICVGKAMSAGAFLLASGTKGKRLCTPNARIMVHQVQTDNIGGTGTEAEVTLKDVIYVKEKIFDIFARHTGQSYEKVEKDCEHDKYLTAEEALDYGIVDRILPSAKPIPKLYKTESERIEATKTLPYNEGS